jgi:hypothetical protein
MYAAGKCTWSREVIKMEEERTHENIEKTYDKNYTYRQ